MSHLQFFSVNCLFHIFSQFLNLFHSVAYSLFFEYQMIGLNQDGCLCNILGLKIWHENWKSDCLWKFPVVGTVNYVFESQFHNLIAD